MSPLRVLVVEDDPDIRDALVLVLEGEHYDVAAARDGAEGLRLAHQHHPDVITLDLMMPVMDGWSFRKIQQHDPALSEIPVVVVTAFAARDQIDAAAFVRKPCDCDELVGVVSEHGRRYRDEHRAAT